MLGNRLTADGEWASELPDETVMELVRAGLAAGITALPEHDQARSEGKLAQFP